MTSTLYITGTSIWARFGYRRSMDTFRGYMEDISYDDSNPVKLIFIVDYSNPGSSQVTLSGNGAPAYKFTTKYSHSYGTNSILGGISAM